MADMALDDTMDMEYIRFSYRMGGISDDEAYDLSIIDEYGIEERHFITRRTKTCSMCKQQGLHWIDTSNGWRLAEQSGSVHRCSLGTDRMFINKIQQLKRKS